MTFSTMYLSNYNRIGSSYASPVVETCITFPPVSGIHSFLRCNSDLVLLELGEVVPELVVLNTTQSFVPSLGLKEFCN